MLSPDSVICCDVSTDPKPNQNPSAHDEPAFHLPQDISYNCQSSGVCCTTFDTIPVDKACDDQLGALSPEQIIAIRKDANAGDQEFMSPGLPGDPPRLTRKADGSCIFFDKDCLCAVHRVAGANSKPQVCRDFPYRYVETPGGVYVGLSFVCPSVRGNVGSPVREQGDALQDHYGVSASVLESQGQIALNSRINLKWEEYAGLENAFAELLSITAVPLRHRLIACCALISFLEAYLQQLTGSAVVGPGNRFPPNAAEDFLQTLRVTNYRDLLRVASRSRKNSPYVKRMFLGMFTSFANTLHRKGGRLRTMAMVMGQYVTHAAGLGRVLLKPVPIALSHRELSQCVLPESGEAAELLERYVRHCIFRKDLLLGGNVARRLRLLVLNTALIPWYAMAEAKHHGRETPELRDYSEGISHVEKFYGFHSRFYRFFEENATFDDVVEAFMLKPNYPYLLLG